MEITIPEKKRNFGRFNENVGPDALHLSQYTLFVNQSARRNAKNTKPEFGKNKISKLQNSNFPI